MKKRNIRIALSFTLLLPLWFAIGFVVLLFPGFIVMMMAPFVFLWKGLQFLVSDLNEYEKDECKQEMKDCFFMFFCPFVAMIVTCKEFIETGKLVIG